MWLISYQYQVVSRDGNGTNRTDPPNDRIALFHEHPAQIVAGQLVSYKEWKQQEPAGGIAAALDSVIIVRRIYSAIEIPDDVVPTVLDDQELQILLAD